MFRTLFGKLRRLEARDWAPVVTLLVLVVFFSLATPRFSFFRLVTLSQILQQGAVLAIVSVGLTFVLLCGEIDLSVGMLATLAGCLCGYLYRELAAPGQASPAAGSASVLALAAAVLVPLAAVVVLGAVSGVLTVWSGLPSFIITLAMMNIADGLAQYISGGEQFTRLPPLLKTLGNEGWMLSRHLELPYSAAVAAGVFVAAHLVLQYTRFGRYVYMVGGNREAARLSGVSPARVVLACLVLSAALAALGGLLGAGRIGAASPTDNGDLLLNAVACVVLGGTSLFGGEGGVGRTLLGVLIFTVLDVGLNKITWIAPDARALLMGVVLLAALVVNGTLARRGPA